MIKQIMSGEPIQTALRLECSGVSVNYYRNPHAFEYTFTIDSEVPFAEAEKVVKEVVQAMCYQSYDHGAEWRQVGDMEYEAPSDRRYYHTFVVSFRIRDAW